MPEFMPDVEPITITGMPTCQGDNWASIQAEVGPSRVAVVILHLAWQTNNNDAGTLSRPHNVWDRFLLTDAKRIPQSNCDVFNGIEAFELSQWLECHGG